jgi:hypothetical protein
MNRGLVICKGFCNKMLRNNFVSNFNLGNRVIITFKFRNTFLKVLWLGAPIIISSF